MKSSVLVLMVLVIGGVALGQDGQFGNLAEQQRTSTVLGGTGMFNTFSTRTLYKGEFDFAVFWNRVNRDPGGLRIDQAPFNFTIGLTNRWELWVDWVAWQKTTSFNPFLLSGYQYNAVRVFGDPVQLLGPASRGKGAAFFPGTGVDGGGILPALGRFGTPAGLNGVSTVSPGGAGGPLVSGLGPAIITNQANFYNDLPFFGAVDFLGFDGLGRPVLGPRATANGSGDIYAGSKYTLIDPNRHWFSMALAGYVKIPISRDDDARARGRTNGEYEYGPTLILGQETPGHRLRFYENVGYIHTGDIRSGGVKVLDLRDKLVLNGGASLALNKHVEFLAEVASTVYVGGGSASLERFNPVDLNLGVRFYLRGGSIAFGGGYRYTLNGATRRTLSVLECVTVKSHDYKDPHAYGNDQHSYGGVPPPPVIECKPTEIEFGEGDRHGFVGFFSIGTRNGCPPPPVPSCSLEVSSAVITRGDRLTLKAKASTPGYADAKLTYQYHWEVKDAQGRTLGLNGSGATVEVPTAQLACGTYSARTTISVTAKGIDHPSGCVTTGESNCTTTFEVTEPPCPTVTCSITASAATVTEGDRVAFRAAIVGAGRSTCTWSTTGGRLSSTTGTEVTLNTIGVTGPVTVRAMVTNDARRCDQACPGSTCAATIRVESIPLPPGRPEVVRPCGPISFPFNSSRINNEHKACLDQVALGLQQDPRAALVIDGHRDSSERVGMSLSRANNARDYLVSEKGVDRARLRVRNFGDTCPHERGDAQLNRRVEFWIIPEGASLSDIDAVKRCRPGSSPREITDEQPALGEPVRPPRGRRPEPISALEEPESRYSSTSSPITNTRSEARLAPASVVRSVSAKVVDGALRVTVSTDGAVEFKDFTLNGPSRIVIDVAGVRSTLGSKTIPVGAGLVDRVRVGEPGPDAVRIVIDVTTMTRYRVIRDGSSLIIIVGEEGAAAGASR